MNLTEVLLAVIISLAVIAGSYFLYASVSEKNAMAQTMQNISLLRANIEDIYDGNYGDESFGELDKMYKLGILPEYFVNLSSTEESTTISLKTYWGSLAISADTDTSRYTLTLDGLSADACAHFGRFQYKSWYKITVNNTAVWERTGESSTISISTLADACNATGNTVVFTAP